MHCLIFTIHSDCQWKVQFHWQMSLFQSVTSEAFTVDIYSYWMFLRQWVILMLLSFSTNVDYWVHSWVAAVFHWSFCELWTVAANTIHVYVMMPCHLQVWLLWGAVAVDASHWWLCYLMFTEKPRKPNEKFVTSCSRPTQSWRWINTKILHIHWYAICETAVSSKL